MKRIVIIRHAKSSWKYNLQDRDRPLKKSGNTDAVLVSKHLDVSNFNTIKVFSSPANRAFSTYKIFAENIKNLSNSIEIVEELYDFGGQKLTNFVKELPDTYTNIMIFGHNHAITAFVNKYGSIYIENVPTCGLVILEFPIETWKELKQGTTTKIIIPKTLR